MIHRNWCGPLPGSAGLGGGRTASLASPPDARPLRLIATRSRNAGSYGFFHAGWRDRTNVSPHHSACDATGATARAMGARGKRAMRGSTATRHAISRARFAQRSARREAKSARTRRSHRTPTRRMGAPEADASATADSSTSARPLARSLMRAGSMSKRRAQRSRVARGVGGWSGTKRWYSWRPWRMRRGEKAEGRAGSSETSLRSCSPHEGHGSRGWEGRGVRREGGYRGSQRGAVGVREPNGV